MFSLQKDRLLQKVYHLKCYYSTSKIPQLPPMARWNRLFPSNMKNRRHRVCLGNPDTAASVAREFFPGSTTSRGKVVIEAFSGTFFKIDENLIFY